MDQTDFITLTQWLSPSYPVGAFSYSHGVETAIATGQISDAKSLTDWLETILLHGTGRSDAILLSHAYRADDPAAIAALADALSPSLERRAESLQQGAAFARTTRAVWDLDLPDMPYPVAVGRAASLRKIPLETTASLYLHSLASNLVSAAIRLIPLGQTDGQRCLHRLTNTIEDVTSDATTAPLEEIGGCAILSDIASMHHETQTVRLFQS